MKTSGSTIYLADNILMNVRKQSFAVYQLGGTKGEGAGGRRTVNAVVLARGALVDGRRIRLTRGSMSRGALRSLLAGAGKNVAVLA